MEMNEPQHPLIAGHRAFVLGLAARFAPIPSLAEDIAQQVFLEFLAKEERWDLSRDIRPLLATMTRHVAARLWRERSVHLSAEMRGLAEHIRQLAEQSEPQAHNEDRLRALKGCLEKLPARSRQLLDWYYAAPLNSAEIADRLGMKAVAVRQALCRLREQLRRCIEGALR